MRKQRFLAMFLAAIMVVGLLPTTVLAAKTVDTPADSGSVVGTAYSDDPNAYEIYPVPHSVTYPGGQFEMTAEVNVVADSGVDTYTIDFVEEILTRFGRTMTTSNAQAAGKTNIVLVIDPSMTESEGHYTPYTLTAQDGVITITGKDTDCVYYGVATLQMMFTSFNGEKFLNATINDYSELKFRGIVEGFYGTGFGTDEVRATQIEGIRDVKGNMYVFAPKADPYHGTQWDALYPDDKLNSLKGLVDTGKANKVAFAWSVHIGKGGVLGAVGATISDELYTQNLEKLQAKFDQLYGIGVRNFHILNDDANSGVYTRQVQLLNDMNAWLKEKGDCGPLIYCCAGYNTAWAGNGAELTALKGLDKDIYLYWTGGDVNSPITPDNVNWAVTRSEHKVATWLNYPCSEHAKSGLFLGNIHHYIKDACAGGMENQIGFFSNPIASPEANKVAYFQLLSWAWHREGYTDYEDKLWENCFKYLQPEVAGAYRTIARNVSNCPGSGRIPQGFPESEYLAETLAAVQTAILNGQAVVDIPEAQGLLDELDNILAAIAALRTNCTSEALKTDLEPWLKSLEDVITAAQAGIDAVDALAENNLDGAWNSFSAGAVALGKWDSHPTSNRNEDYWNKVNVKAGSKRLQPFANTVLDYVKQAMAQAFNPGGGLTGDEATFYARLNGNTLKPNAESAKVFDGDPSTCGNFNTVQMLDDYYGVDLGSVKMVGGVDILQGNSDTDHDYFHNGALEYSVDGKNWETLVSNVNSRHIQVEGLNVAARYVRLRLTKVGYGSKNDYWTHVREFAVTVKDGDPLYTNVPGLNASPAVDGGVYTLAIPSTELNAGDYVGIQLPELRAIQAIAAENLSSDVVLEWSVSGESWTAGTPGQAALMGYVRLRATAPAALNDVTLTAAETVHTELSFVSSNTALSGGTSWDNVVDGDRATKVYVGERQAFGQYAIFDLGGTQPVQDVTVWIPETGDDIPHNLDIFVGNTTDPNGSWQLIAELRDNHYDMDVPYRYFSCNGDGKVGRYLKLAIADVDARNWYYINELEVNTTVSTGDVPTAISATSGKAAAANDGDLLTFLTPDENQGGSWQKLLQAPTLFNAITILRGVDGASAVVEVEKNNAWERLGTLSDSATTFQLADVGAITGLRITWTASDVPSIAEVIFSGESVPAGAAPILYPNIYEQPANPVTEAVTVLSGTALENIPLPETVNVTTSGGLTAQAPITWSCADYDPDTAGDYTFTGVLGSATLTNPGCFTFSATVTVRPVSGGVGVEGNLSLNQPVFVSGTENGTTQPGANAVDGNQNNQWNSNHMSSGSANSKTDLGSAWIVVDLGEGLNDIAQVDINFFNLIWPTDYKLQVAGADFTPVDFSSNGVKAENDASVNAATYSGDNAENAACWTTLKSFSGVTYQAHPQVTVTKAEFENPIPADSRYFRLYATALNHAAAGNSLGIKELTVTGTRTVPPSVPNVASVAAASVKGVTGDAWTALALPTHVVATLADSTTARLAVTWDAAGYDNTLTTAQTFTGTLNLPDGVTNTDNVTATLTVTLEAPPTVVGYTLTPNRVTALHRTPFADLPLPENAVVQFSNGDTRALSVQWSADSYDPSNLKDQEISGTVDLPWGGTHSVTVSVGLTPILSNQVTLNKTSLTLYANEDHPNHTDSLIATVGPANASDQTVNWRTGDPAVAVVSSSGAVTATGVGETTITATAHDGSLAYAACAVTVRETLGGSVIITKPTADAGYYFDALLRANLAQMTPQGAKNDVTYQWKRDGVNIDGATAQEYTPVQDDIGHTITVTVSGTGFYEGSITSDAVTVEKAPGLRLKATPKSVGCTTDDNNDGKITGLFKGRLYEYKLVSETQWIPFSDMSGDETASEEDYGTAEISPLPAGSYHVRRAETNTHTAGPQSYTVTVVEYNAVTYNVDIPRDFDGGRVTADNRAPKEGLTVTLEVIPADGYQLIENSLTVTSASGSVTLTPVDGVENKFTFTMPAEDVTVSAEFEPLTFTITHDLTNIGCDLPGDHSHSVKFGERPTITLTPAVGYHLPETLKVYTKASVDADPTAPVEFNGYQFRLNDDSSGKGTITFTRNIMEDLVVTGEGVLNTYTVDYQLTGMDAPVGNPTAVHGRSFSVYLSAAEGYYLPAAVTVTMGGQPFTDFTFVRESDTDGRIKIGKDKVSGDLVITAVGADSATFGFTASPAALTGGGTVRLVAALSRDAYDAAVGDNVLLNPDPTVLVVTCDDTSIEIMPVMRSSSDYTIHYNVTLPDRTKTYTFTATLAGGVGFAAGEETCTVAVTKSPSRPSGSSSSSTPSTSTTTETREDGATVTTVTKPDGTVTETVKQPDGTKTEAVTTKDGDKTITVTDPEGEEIIKVEIPAVIPEVEEKFEDLDSVPWAEEAVNNVAALELVKGTGGNKYDPVAPMTRGSLATVLHRLSQGKTDYEVAFKDVAANKYYTEGVAWAAKANVVTGYTADIFAPDDIITREQLAVMLARYAKLIGMDTTADAKSLDQFVDADKTGGWAVNGVAWCVEQGLLKGKGQNNLDPTAEISRAEVAVLLDRFIALMK